MAANAMEPLGPHPVQRNRTDERRLPVVAQSPEPGGVPLRLTRSAPDGESACAVRRERLLYRGNYNRRLEPLVGRVAATATTARESM
jgi:hypothetical protein